MISAYTAATNGLLDAANSFSKVANQSVADFAQGSAYVASEPETQAPVATIFTNRTLPTFPVQGTSLYTPSYAEDILSVKQAAAAYKASIKIFKTVDDTTQTVINSVR